MLSGRHPNATERIVGFQIEFGMQRTQGGVVFQEHPPKSNTETGLLGNSTASFSERLACIHAHLRRKFPGIDRISFALYDPKEDLLKTFVHSSEKTNTLSTYQRKLSSIPSLLSLKEERRERVIDDIPQSLTAETEHTLHIKQMGYRSSYTLPVFYRDTFEGFLFLDSQEKGTFTPEMRSGLEVYISLIMVLFSREMSSFRAMLSSLQLARDISDLRDEETGGHLDRMSRFCRLIARALAASHQLSDEFIEQLFLFAPMHDIGKVGIPDAVLHKPGGFTPEERKTMETHVEIGSRMIERLIQDFNLRQVDGIDILRNLVAYHHDYLDGSGYPHRVNGTAIPIEARIVTVADIFDALTSKRVYKAAWSAEDAINNLEHMAAEGKLDPACVDALKNNLPEAVKIIQRFQ
jgi:HD-GYP domain-containing protein (c-di-GMP phosphodiesterase class II)